MSECGSPPSAAVFQPERIDDVEALEAVDVTVAPDDAAHHVLAHEEGGAEVVEEGAARLGDACAGRGQDLRVARRGVSRRALGERKSASRNAYASEADHGCRYTRGWVATRRNS